MKEVDAPPAKVTRGTEGFWLRVAATAAAKPGTWFEVDGLYHRSLVTHLKSGKMQGLEGDRFDVTSRKDPVTGQSRIYVRARS